MSNKIKVIILLIPVLVITFSNYLYPEEETTKKILQKSLLFPGWGQIHEKQYLKGFLFASAEIFCLFKIIKLNKKANEFYHKYRNADNVNDTIEFREMTEKYDKKRNKFILAGAAVWIINMIDLYIFLKKKNKKKVALYCGQNGKKKIYLGINIHF